MKEKLSSVVEKLKMIGQLVLMPFVMAGIVFAVIGEKTGRFFENRKRTFIAVGAVVVLLVSWLGTGFTVVGSQSVKVVRYPDRLGSTSLILFEKPVAIVNDTDGVKIYYTYPRIPYIPGIGQTNIGAKEESYSLKEPLEFNEKIGLFSLYELTGDTKDQNTVVYLTISGTFEVTDWEVFLSEFDPKLVEEEFQGKSRSELTAINIGSHIFFGNVNNWFAETVSRTFLAEKFAKENNLKTEEEIEYFIKVYRSWYWSLGAMYFHYFEEEVMRNPFPSSQLYKLGQYCVIAATTEEALDYNTQKLELFENQKEAFCEELDPAAVNKAELIVAAFKGYLKDKGRNWPIYFAKEELSEFLIKSQLKGEKYTPQELYTARTLVDLEATIEIVRENIELLNERACMFQEFFKSLRTWQSKGNDSLWKFAIQRAVEGKGMPEPADFYPWLKADGMEYLAEVAEFYQELGLFEGVGVKFTGLTFSLEEVVEETSEKAPAK